MKRTVFRILLLLGLAFGLAPAAQKEEFFMKHTILRVLLLLGLVLSLIPALSAHPVAHSPSEPFLIRFFGDFHEFLVAVNIWPFFFLQLLLCSLIPGLLGLFLLPGLTAAGLFAGFAFASSQQAGGILIILMALVFFAAPLAGSLLGLAVWVILRTLIHLL